MNLMTEALKPLLLQVVLGASLSRSSLSRFTLAQPGLDYKIVQTGFTL